MSIEGRDRSSTIILVSPVSSSLLSNLTSSGCEGVETPLLSIPLLDEPDVGLVGCWFEMIAPLLEEGSSPLIKRWAWILPVAACTEMIAVAAAEFAPMILKQIHSLHSNYETLF